MHQPLISTYDRISYARVDLSHPPEIAKIKSAFAEKYRRVADCMDCVAFEVQSSATHQAIICFKEDVMALVLIVNHEQTYSESPVDSRKIDDTLKNIEVAVGVSAGSIYATSIRFEISSMVA
ncbi:hypothetical protein M446_2462 [Methylobacterium sp. 4-46]|nr:hypothetical protein M446_2462 [Methylobacterium sp. 4-46]